MDLITGSTGIVGIHLLYACTNSGERVRALYRKGGDRSIVATVFKHYSRDAEQLLEKIEWVEGELQDIGSLKDAMSGIDRVYHAAAMVSFAPGDTRTLYKVNAGGTANVVNAALLQGIHRLCHVSSTAAIGQAAPSIERDETIPWSGDRSTSSYAASKYESELEVYRGIAEGLDAVIVNPCVIIGPGAAGRSTMTLIEKMKKGTRFYPPGSNSVVDARDVATCMRMLMERGGTGE
ncbi:MAG: NAD-dependent epimerase/dehydratase family protein, partial [Bacteroidota bacterium]|nr:NAD-dependent epimerase/dehydratase family protein [Bacteroidota bacterium]